MSDARRLALSHFGALWLHFKHFPSTIFFLAVSKIFFFLHLKISVKSLTKKFWFSKNFTSPQILDFLLPVIFDFIIGASKIGIQETNILINFSGEWTCNFLNLIWHWTKTSNRPTAVALLRLFPKNVLLSRLLLSYQLIRVRNSVNGDIFRMLLSKIVKYVADIKICSHFLW